MTDVEFWVPKDHLLQKIEKVMDYDWLYERLSPYYCAYNERLGSIRGCSSKWRCWSICTACCLYGRPTGT